MSAVLLAALACNLPNPERPGMGEVMTPYKDKPASALVDPFPAKPFHTKTAMLPRLSQSAEPEIAFGPPGVSPADPERPELSGTPQTLDTEHFRIHYTTSGGDAVPPTDQNNNQHPDYVETVARALEYIWDTEINYFGWPAPPSDGSLGGDERYDVYLENIIRKYDDVLAYTEGSTERERVGDNPNSPEIEKHSYYSYIVLDNDYAEMRGYNNSSPLEHMRVTAAHEFFHAIQYGIDGTEPAEWIWEAAATWMEDEVYDQINDNLELLTIPFKSADSCQVSYGGDTREEDEQNWYGQWIFFRYISERYGHGTVRAIIMNSVGESHYNIFTSPLHDVNTDINAVLNELSVAMLLRDFDEGHEYPAVRLEGNAKVGETFFPRDGIGQMGTDFIEVLGDGLVTVRLESDDPALTGQLAALSGGQADIYLMPENHASIDLAAYEHVYLVVTNKEKVQRERQCSYTSYQVQVTQGGAPGNPAAHRAAPNFRPPRVEVLAPFN